MTDPENLFQHSSEMRERCAAQKALLDTVHIVMDRCAHCPVAGGGRGRDRRREGPCV